VSYLLTYLLPDGYPGNELPGNGSPKLRFSSANGAGLFTADVMFIYIFMKNELGLTHRDN